MLHSKPNSINHTRKKKKKKVFYIVPKYHHRLKPNEFILLNAQGIVDLILSFSYS